jgi:hypothetical protein
MRRAQSRLPLPTEAAAAAEEEQRKFDADSHVEEKEQPRLLAEAAASMPMPAASSFALPLAPPASMLPPFAAPMPSQLGAPPGGGGIRAPRPYDPPGTSSAQPLVASSLFPGAHMPPLRSSDPAASPLSPLFSESGGVPGSYDMRCWGASLLPPTASSEWPLASSTASFLPPPPAPSLLPPPPPSAAAQAAAASGASGLSNATGEYNCLLNSLVQALFRLSCFQKLRLPSNRRASRGVHTRQRSADWPAGSEATERQLKSDESARSNA